MPPVEERIDTAGEILDKREPPSPAGEGGSLNSTRKRAGPRPVQRLLRDVDVRARAAYQFADMMNNLMRLTRLQ